MNQKLLTTLTEMYLVFFVPVAQTVTMLLIWNWRCIYNNNKNTGTMFTVLLSWHRHCKSWPRSFDKCTTLNIAK